MHHTHGLSWVPVAKTSLIILLLVQSVDDEKSRVLEAMRPRRLRTASAITAGGNVIQTVGCRQLHINKSIACQPHHPRRLCLMVWQYCIFSESAQVYYEFKIKYRVELENNMAKILV